MAKDPLIPGYISLAAHGMHIARQNLVCSEADLRSLRQQLDNNGYAPVDFVVEETIAELEAVVANLQQQIERLKKAR